MLKNNNKNILIPKPNNFLGGALAEYLNRLLDCL